MQAKGTKLFVPATRAAKKPVKTTGRRKVKLKGTKSGAKPKRKTRQQNKEEHASKSRQFSTISAKRLSEILGDKSYEVLESGSGRQDDDKHNKSQNPASTSGRRLNAKHIRRKEEANVAWNNNLQDRIESRLTDSRSEGRVDGDIALPEAPHVEMKVQHDAKPAQIDQSEDLDIAVSKLSLSAEGASPSLLNVASRDGTPDYYTKTEASVATQPPQPEIHTDATNKENVSGPSALPKDAFVDEFISDEQKELASQAAKQAALRRDLDEQIRLKNERKARELKIQLQQNFEDATIRRQQFQDINNTKPQGRGRGTSQTAQMRFENRLNAVRSQVFGEREDMSEVLEEKRRREKETLLKQMEECRRRKEQERIREEELQRLDDERVERERRALAERWNREMRSERSNETSAANSPSHSLGPTREHSHGSGSQSLSLQNNGLNGVTDIRQPRLPNNPHPRPVIGGMSHSPANVQHHSPSSTVSPSGHRGPVSSFDYDELSRWCQQLMSEQQKMREDLVAHRRVNEALLSESKKSHELIEEIEILRKKVDSIHEPPQPMYRHQDIKEGATGSMHKTNPNSRAPMTFPSNHSTQMPASNSGARSRIPTSVPAPLAESPRYLPPRSKLPKRNAAPGWANRPKDSTSFSIPTHARSPPSQPVIATNNTEFEEEPLPNFSSSTPVFDGPDQLDQVGPSGDSVAELGTATTFVFPEDESTLSVFQSESNDRQSADNGFRDGGVPERQEIQSPVKPINRGSKSERLISHLTSKDFGSIDMSLHARSIESKRMLEPNRQVEASDLSTMIERHIMNRPFKEENISAKQENENESPMVSSTRPSVYDHGNLEKGVFEGHHSRSLSPFAPNTMQNVKARRGRPRVIDPFARRFG